MYSTVLCIGRSVSVEQKAGVWLNFNVATPVYTTSLLDSASTEHNVPWAVY